MIESERIQSGALPHFFDNVESVFLFSFILIFGQQFSKNSIFYLMLSVLFIIFCKVKMVF